MLAYVIYFFFGVNRMRICDLYCKPYGPRSDCLGLSSLIRVHSVILHDKICFGEN